ncbi:MAG: VWA domain-containing protein [Chloroflexi bacterium]|nr:VWA domain-containing protein [Chloroflexota bacterium]
MADATSGHILHNLLLFGRLLRRMGLDVHVGRMLDAVAVIDDIGLAKKGDFRATLRTLLVHRKDDLALFDEAFEVFWRQPKDPQTTMDLRSMGEQRRFRQPQVGPPPPGSSTNGLDDGQDDSEEDIDRIDLTRTFSAREVLRKKSFAEYTPDEFTQARVMIEELQWDLGRRRTRRWGRGDGRQLDLRRALRSSLRYGGEPVELPTKRRKTTPRRLVLICDVSGSMERYTRMLLQFIHTLYGGLDNRVEAFLFATRLTRVTGHLDHRDIDRAIDEVSKAVPDWSGGTRIGDILRTFNFRWGRRVLGWGSVVLVISDGWDRGEPDQFGREMARLQRSSHRLIWLNPLAGAENYEPLTRGMRAAMPYIDDLLPIHNLASLEDLARRLNTLSDRRPERRQHIAPPEPEDDAPATARVRGSSRHRAANPTFRHPLWGREG